jgi:hypothetical protein
MNLSPEEKKHKLNESHKLFLEVFPLEDIDHPGIRLICRSFRHDNCSEYSAKTLLSRHEEYFLNWIQSNKMIDAFYGKR